MATIDAIHPDTSDDILLPTVLDGQQITTDTGTKGTVLGAVCTNPYTHTYMLKVDVPAACCVYYMIGVEYNGTFTPAHKLIVK